MTALVPTIDALVRGVSTSFLEYVTGSRLLQIGPPLVAKVLGEHAVRVTLSRAALGSSSRIGFRRLFHDARTLLLDALILRSLVDSEQTGNA
jgi:hypothetical protein